MIVEFVTAAEQELDGAVTYYELQQPGLGVQFALEVGHAVQRILEYPRAWQALPGGTRRCLLRRFDYGFMCKIRNDVATVSAVMHLKRRP